MKIFTASLFTALLFCTQALAATATGSASAEVDSGLAISQVTPMNFGTFSAGATAGSISTFGIESGGVTTISPGNNAKFRVTGAPGESYIFTMPVNITLSSGANSMTATVVALVDQNYLDAQGVNEFQIVAQLAVGANQAPGTYIGTYDVSVHHF